MSHINVDHEKCISDSICAAECPARLIRMDRDERYPIPVKDFEDICFRCGHCVAVCPTGAISFEWLSPEDCTPIRQELAITPEQAEQFLCSRRSVRVSQDKPVPRDILEKLLEIACMAPSAKNEQPWHWIVVEDPAEVRRLAGMVVHWMRGIVQANPHDESLVGFVRAVSSWDEGYDRICRGAPHVVVAHADRNWGFGAEDCALALSNLDLYGTSRGLGACWAGYLYHAINACPPLFEALGLPEGHRAFGAMMVGYPGVRYERIPLRRKPRVTWK